LHTARYDTKRAGNIAATTGNGEKGKSVTRWGEKEYLLPHFDLFAVEKGQNAPFSTCEEVGKLGRKNDWKNEQIVKCK
jgi:hypothetical protein